MGAAYQDLTARAPDNVTSGDWTITVNGTYACGLMPQVYDLSAATMGSGRWVLVKATNITGYVGATITNAPSGRTVVGVSQENVNFPADGTKACVVVTLA